MGDTTGNINTINISSILNGNFSEIKAISYFNDGVNIATQIFDCQIDFLKKQSATVLFVRSAGGGYGRACAIQYIPSSKTFGLAWAKQDSSTDRTSATTTEWYYR